MRQIIVGPRNGQVKMDATLLPSKFSYSEIQHFNIASPLGKTRSTMVAFHFEWSPLQKVKVECSAVDRHFKVSFKT